MSATKKQKKTTKPFCLTIDPIVFKTLEDWRWANRMSRSKAISFILEKFLSNLKTEDVPKQQELKLK